MFDRTVVPLDGSRFAETALPLATRLCRRSTSRLHLVMIAEPSGPTARECEEYIARVAARVAQDTTGEVTSSVRAGNIVERLKEEAESVGAEMTVMATHGRGGLSRMWLGSIAVEYLHETDKPLLLVRPDANEGAEPAVPRGFTKLLVPLDGTELSEGVLVYATELGQMFDTSYHVVRIVSPPVDVGSPYVPPSVDVTSEMLTQAVRTAEEYVANRAERLREGGRAVTTSVVVDTQPGRGILAVAEAEGCDAIAMATHGRLGLSRAFLGSAADKVLRGARVPLLLYRPGSLPE